MHRSLLVVGVVLGGLAATPAAADASSCSRFIVGAANSSSYTDGKLPASGSTARAACRTLRTVAKRLHRGTYVLPPQAFGRNPHWGRPSPLRHAGRTWRCAVQNVGGSGPSYRVRCSRGAARMSWSTAE